MGCPLVTFFLAGFLVVLAMVSQHHADRNFGKGQRVPKAVNHEPLIIFIEFIGMIDKEHQGRWLGGNLGGVVDFGHAHLGANRGSTLFGDARNHFV